jgi:outer membrane protein OmpA-like peptidoglycan-associated protein
MAIRFDFNSAHLRPEGASVLDRPAAALQTPDLKSSRFLIEGHTDAQGSADYNLRLSQSRADEVRRYLVAQGLAPQRLSSVGRGSREPADPSAPMSPENRRVRIVNLDD